MQRVVVIAPLPEVEEAHVDYAALMPALSAALNEWIAQLYVRTDAAVARGASVEEFAAELKRFPPPTFNDLLLDRSIH